MSELVIAVIENHPDCYVDHHYVRWSDRISRCYYCAKPKDLSL